MKYNWCSPESETKADVAQMGLLIYAGNDVEDLHKPVYLNQLNRRESRGGTQIMKISKRGGNLKRNIGVGETKRGGDIFKNKGRSQLFKLNFGIEKNKNVDF